MEDCPTLDQGKNVRSLGPEVEGATGTMCDEWAAVPHSPSPCLGGCGNLGSEVKGRKKRRMGGR